jgi:hypothetical protein
MKNLEFKTLVTINEIVLEIRKYADTIEILAVNPANSGHKISKTLHLQDELVTFDNVTDIISNLNDIDDFVSRSKAMFLDPTLVPDE